MARTEYSPEFKAQVIASLLTGQSLSATAKQYNLPKGTVSNWRSSNKSLLPVRTQKEKSDSIEIGDLLQTYLKQNIKALTEQTKLFADPEWLRQQDAPGVAVLHGVMTDKAVRLMEAFGANDNDTQAED